MESFVRDYLGNTEQHFVDEHQDNMFGPIRINAVAAGQNESGAKQARDETKARYGEWKTQKDKASAARISIFREVFRQDQKKPFDEACQSFEFVFAWSLTSLAGRGLKKWCCDLHAARKSLANHLSRDTDVRWMIDAMQSQVAILKEPAVAHYLLSRNRGKD